MKLSDLKAGDTVTLDDGFTCVAAGNHTVEKDEHGFFVKCSHERHYLDGQEDEDGELIGVSKPQYHIHIYGNSPDNVTTHPEVKLQGSADDIARIVAEYETKHGKCSSFGITLVPVK